MHPEQPVVCGRRGHHTFRLSEAGVDLLEPREKPGQRARADRDVPSDPHVAPAQLPGHNARAFLRVGLFEPEQIFRKMLAELPVSLDDAVDRDRATPRQPP